MTYELAKRLKDAGFPQHENFRELCDDPYVCCVHQWRLDHKTGETKDEPYQPTLEELIVACGKSYQKQYEFFLTWSVDKWFACFLDANFKSPDLPNGEGPTPTEAVANLWLALNTTRN